MGLPYYRPFMAKLHYIEFWVTNYNRGGWPLKQFFSQEHVRDGAFYGKIAEPFNRGGWCSRLISYIVPTMVGEWVYHIPVLLWQNCITLNFGWLAITGLAGHLSYFSEKNSRWRAKPFMGN